MRRLAGVTIAFTLSLAATAAAQDYGTQWLDRISRAMVEGDAPLPTIPVTVSASGGELFTYDSNIFLSDTKTRADSIFTTFGQVGVQYSQVDFDAEADLTANYNAYAHHNDSSSDEERFFGRARWQGSRVSVSLAQILRRESSPTDVVFVDRVQRLLSNTTPLIVVEATDDLSFELQTDLQFVKFHRREFESANNTNTRTALTVAYNTGWNNLEALIQAGYLTINYSESISTDAAGFYGRVGGRGQLTPGLYAAALAGITQAESDDFPGTTVSIEHATGDVEFNLAYAVTERANAYASYSRRIGFAAGGAAFQVIDAAGLSGDLALRDDVKVRARLQYDRVHGPFVVGRAYYSGGVGAEYRLHENVLIDGGVTYRTGVALVPGGSGDFRDFIVSVGLAVLLN